MANKKINQLVAKTTIQSTDLFPIGDASTGTLYKKTIADLQAAIGGAVISVNGLVGTVVLDADDILETGTPTNRYFTEARARASISLTTSGSSGASTYSSSTGVLNVPTYTLAGLGGITASFLSGGTGISYNSSTGVISYSGTVYTDSSVRGLFSAGTGLSYNSSTGVFTNSITQYTDALARAAISATSPITYNSTTGVIGISTGNLTESTSSVLTITGGTGALISSASIQVKQASGSQSGFLSSTDWTTFNNKQSALSGGTAGYVTFWTGSSTISGDSGLFWNNTSKRLGIGTSSPNSPLTVSGGNISLINGGVNIDNGYQLVFAPLGASEYSSIEGSSVSSSLCYMRFLTNSNERMRITSTGNIGIGTTSPTALLDISGNDTNRTGLRIFNSNTANGDKEIQIFVGGTSAFGITSWQNSGVIESVAGLSSNFVLSNYQTGAIIFQNSGRLERMRITSGGTVAIGNPGNGTGYGIEILNTFSQPRVVLIDNSNYTGVFKSNGLIVTLSNDSANALTLNTTAVERMRITAGGNILMGTTTDNGERLYVSGSIRATGTITANSDISLKKNLAKIENALEKVEQINGYTYEFKEDDSKRHAGVIAQEIQGVLPEIVNKGNDGLLGVEYGNISALLIEAIKDLKSQNESLVARLEALEK